MNGGSDPTSITYLFNLKGFKNQMSKYKLIQLTNTNIGAVDAGSYLPLGVITRRLNTPTEKVSTFEVVTSGSNLVYINEPGYYKVTYNSTLTAGAAGTLGISLVVGGNTVYTVSEEVTAAEDVVNMTLAYVIRVCPNSCSAPYNCPVSIQLLLEDVALGTTPSPSVGNLIIERVF
jgi:hypothetical protein